MSEQTSNYGFIKPSEDEFYDIENFNFNMDKIDEKMKTNAEATVVQLDNAKADMNNKIFITKQLSAELTRNVLQHTRTLKQLTGETGVVTLTNTLDYPFNNSQKTISLDTKKDTLAYAVDLYCTDKNVGNFLVTDKQLNGFKLEFTGGAPMATVHYVVRGGNL